MQSTTSNRSVVERDPDDRTPFERDLEEWQRPRRIDLGDRSIAEDLRDQLSCHPDIDASDIEISVENGEIALGGSVGEARMKHIAEECAHAVPGARRVHNRLRVRPGSRG